MPATQATHVLSAVALPAVFCPCPAAQVCQVVQEDRPALSVNVPEAHAAHARSLEFVSSAVSYCPAAHSPVISVHALPSLVSEYLPVAHAAH